jgi:Protein of unknown function (DUF742)
MGSAHDRYLDREAGPVVRPYAVTGGRTQPRGERLDLISVVAATGQPAPGIYWLEPEHHQILALCSRPVPVADVASELEIPLGVVRVLLGDLHSYGLIKVFRSGSHRHVTDMKVLRTVLDGLQGL